MAFTETEHDHRQCVAAALATAEILCRRRGQRLTVLRRRVLELVWESHRPVGAYALLEQLQKTGKAAPATVYRTLDFLQRQGLVHRLESLNAYVGCARPDMPHVGQFLICDACQELAEIDNPDIVGAIQESAQAAGFSVQHPTVEIRGLCPKCR